MIAGEINADCVFCKIIRGEIPCQRIFDSPHVLAFLDINPLSQGHTVVIPKHHTERLEDLPEEWSVELARSFGLIARAVTGAVGAEAYNLLQNNGSLAGQVVPHVHFHIIPRRADDGLGYRWKAKPASADELRSLAERVRAAF